MTVSKGTEWGTLVVPGPGMRTVRSDTELRELVLSTRAAGHLQPVVGLLGGDMMRTLGGRADASRFTGDEPIPHLPVDIVSVGIDDAEDTIFVSHLVARGPTWWRGPVTAAMNAQFLGRWDVSPRCHPNDGKVDVVTVSAELGTQQRWLARRRLLLGTHVPHPHIAIKQRATAEIDLGAPRSIWIDGRRAGRGRHLRLVVEPDALVVCV